MGSLFLEDEREDFFAMIKEVAQRVENLGLGYAQALGNFQYRFAAPVKRGDVAHGNPQTVDDGLASANGIDAKDVRVLRNNDVCHLLSPG